MKKLIVFVPCYNEEDAIHPMSNEFDVLNFRLRARNIELKIVWVDDCSRDKTLTHIESSSSKFEWQSYIHHDKNRGLVGVLETMLKQWNNKSIVGDSDILGVGLLDGDNSHPAIFFEDMVSRLEKGYDVVIASRFQIGSIVEGVPWNRQLLSLGMSVLFRLVGQVPNVRDYSCGFRIYSPRILNKVSSSYLFKKRSFACMVELLMTCHRRGAYMCEVPFILRYDQKKSASKMQVYRTIRETLGVLLSR